MSKVPVGKGIRISLQPDYDGMNLAERPDQRMVDEEVNNEGCDKQGKRNVDSMDPGNQLPSRLKFYHLLVRRNVASSGRSSSRPLLTCAQ